MAGGQARRPALIRNNEPNDGDPFPEIHGSSPEIRTLKRRMWCVARDPDVTALVVGESGTGKELVARAVHRASPRGDAPFVVVDCAGLSASLAEDALFGHVRGAFTGAIGERPGPFERAHGGTILLDEIGDLPRDLQMKLLRALQSRTIQRLGARQETAFDVRIIAATNVDLATAIARGAFRQDLYYRLKVFEIRVPSLRRRGADDIRALVKVIVDRLAERRRRAPPSIDPQVLDTLVRHSWPGNVRELENTLEHLIVASAGAPVLSGRHLPEDFGSTGSAVVSHIPQSADRIREVLLRNDFRYGRTAVELGLSRHQLYRLVRRHGIRDRAGDR